MRVAVVGPAHPFKGGVATHTTETSRRLAAAGHDVDLVAWSRLYPERLYPGEQAVPPGGPDVPPYPRTSHPLRWDRPAGWWRTGRSLRDRDLVVLVLVTPLQVPALLALARAARPARVLVLAHNVVPHEPVPGGQRLVSRLLRAADAVLVHSPSLAEQARAHGARRVVCCPLPPHLPGGPPPAGPRRRGRVDPLLRVLALGIVREYKGVDLLLEAAAQVQDVAVCVAGEQWGAAGRRVRELAGDPRLAGRVELRSGYVPGAEVPALMAANDVLSLTYRHATASQNVLLARGYGMPVLASDVGTFPADVTDGVDGLIVPAGDVGAIAAALRRLAEAGELARLQAGVPELDLDSPWDTYVKVIADA